MSTNQLLKLTLLAGMDVTAMTGTLAGAADEPATSAAAVSAATSKKPAATGKPALTAKDVWGHDYAHARQRAKKLNRPVLVHFHASWCGPCQQMEREVLNSAPVLSALNVHCVAVKIDCDQEPSLTQQFGVAGLPCDMLVTPDGKLQHVNTGLLSAADYSSLISRVAKPKTDTRIQVSAN
jgi:thioredoxin-like negative regulator of GroEL